MVNDGTEIEYNKDAVVEILKSSFDDDIVESYLYLFPYENSGPKIYLVNGVIAIVEAIVTRYKEVYPAWTQEFIMEWSNYVVDRILEE